MLFFYFVVCSFVSRSASDFESYNNSSTESFFFSKYFEEEPKVVQHDVTFESLKFLDNLHVGFYKNIADECYNKHCIRLKCKQFFDGKDEREIGICFDVVMLVHKNVLPSQVSYEDTSWLHPQVRDLSYIIHFVVILVLFVYHYFSTRQTKAANKGLRYLRMERMNEQQSEKLNTGNIFTRKEPEP